MFVFTTQTAIPNFSLPGPLSLTAFIPSSSLFFMLRHISLLCLLLLLAFFSHASGSCFTRANLLAQACRCELYVSGKRLGLLPIVLVPNPVEKQCHVQPAELAFLKSKSACDSFRVGWRIDLDKVERLGMQWLLCNLRREKRSKRKATCRCERYVCNRENSCRCDHWRCTKW